MFLLSSRSATVLVIFVIAVIAFCLASVFGAMTGTISILPNESDSSGGILNNLSAISDGTGDTGVRYDNANYDSSSSSSSNVETTQDSSSQSGSSSSSSSNTGHANDNAGQANSQSSPNADSVEKTTQDSSGSNVETTVG